MEETRGEAGSAGSPGEISDATPRQATIGWRANFNGVESFSGEIADVRLWGRALSEAEIAAGMHADRR